MKIRVIEPAGAAAEPMPDEFSRSRVRRSLLALGALAAALIAVLALAPDLGSLRADFAGAEPGWLALAAVLEVLSCASYVLVFRYVFCQRMRWRTSAEIGLSECAANSLLSVGGAGGLALGAWILRRGGVPGGEIARRTVAFFLLTSLANVGFLALAGAALATRVLSGPSNVLLGIVPAMVGAGAVLLGLAARPAGQALAARTRRQKVEVTMKALTEGVDEAVTLLRSREPAIAVGSAGYMLFDIAVLAVCFPAFGNPLPPVAVLLLAYIIGQLGALVPLPGGIGGLDLGLIGALALYGVDATDAAVAVIAYRGLLLAVPAAIGLPALASLHRRMRREQSDIAACVPGQEVEVLGGGRIRAPQLSSAAK
ncbi:MAG: lysylphosphatidylglycerol synthase transmembrane domain-containing protein [Solirubrobacterales bacterium]